MKCAINLMGFQRFDEITKPNKNKSSKGYVFVIVQSKIQHKTSWTQHIVLHSF